MNTKKNQTFVEDLPREIPAGLALKWFCGFREEYV
jgi:hypothetical protein